MRSGEQSHSSRAARFLRSGAAALLPVALATTDAGGQPAGPGPAECRLPATTVVEQGKVSMPAGIGTLRVAIAVGQTPRGAWRRGVGDRSSVAEIPLAPRLQYDRVTTLQATVLRRPTAGELDSLATWLAERAAGVGALDASLGDSAETALSSGCRRWDLPDVASAPPSRPARDSIRLALAARRAEAHGAARDLARAIEAARRPTGWIARVRTQASAPRGGTARELLTLDELLRAEPADTAADRVASFGAKVGRADRLLATWSARPPHRVTPHAVDSALRTVSALEARVRALDLARSRVASTVADSVGVTSRVGAELLAAFGEGGFVTEVRMDTVTVPQPDAGKIRLGVGLHYTAPFDSPLLGHPRATNRVFPNAFVHWSPQETGGRRPWTLDVGLALNAVGSRREARELFWRSSLLAGISVHPRGFLRVGVGVQLVREPREDGSDLLRIPLYVAISVAQFKL